MNTAVSTDTNQVAAFSRFLDKFKSQMQLALPKHMTADRMTRLALTQFSSTPKLQECTPQSIAASIMTASTLGLEPGVNGQGFLVPYYDKRKQASICQFIPGWKGLVDIANRSGRVSVWTGAVFHGDDFEYGLGDRPFVTHRPGDEDDPNKLTHVYAVGRVKGSDWPVIEVWRMSKIWKHRDTFNKVGGSHYSYRDPEMYARKVPLLQVLKYMPSSIELSNAITANNAAESGRGITINGDFVAIDPEPEDDGVRDTGSAEEDLRQAAATRTSTPTPAWTDKAFADAWPNWQKALAKKGADGIISMAETKGPLSDDQKKAIRAMKPAQAAQATTPVDTDPVFTEAQIAAKLDAANNLDALALAGSLISSITDPKARNRLSVKYDERGEALPTQE